MTAVRLSPEDRLILLCARLKLSSDQRARLERTLQEGKLRWEEVLLRTECYRVSALLFHHLRSLEDRSLVPEWAMESLKAVYVHNAVRNSYLRSKLHEVIRTLSATGIPFILLKGAALLETVYSNPALRPMADIDLMVPEDKADKAQQLVCGLGYHAVGSPEVQERTRREHRHLPTLVDQYTFAIFEVHSHIVRRDSPLRFDIAGFWGRAREIPIAGVTAKILAPEHQVIHLAVNFLLDRRYRSDGALYQLCDLAETLRHYEAEFDWAFFERQTIGDGLHGPVYCGLSLAKRLLDAPVPQDILERLRPLDFNSSLEDLLLARRVMNTGRALASELVPARSDYSFFRLVQGLVRRIVPSRTYLSERYGDAAIAKHPAKSYLRRWAEAIELSTRYLRNPVEVWREIQVDRCIHFLSSERCNRADAGSQRLVPAKEGETRVGLR